MKVLVACEESQAVTIEFRRLGHEAQSCDLLDQSGGHPEWHIKGDALELINGNCLFVTTDGEPHTIDGTWDLLIAFPPCTQLTTTGNKWFNVDVYGQRAIERFRKRTEAISFFKKIVNANCQRIAVENPVGIMSSEYRKPDQIVQPFMFGHNARKRTCLWLKNLPLLIPTEMVDQGIVTKQGLSVGASADSARKDNGKTLRWNDPRTAIIRSKTPIGIAKAMATQWSKMEDK